MPHLVSSALVSDPDGMEFLRAILEVPGEDRRPRPAFAMPADDRLLGKGPRILRPQARRRVRVEQIA